MKDKTRAVLLQVLDEPKWTPDLVAYLETAEYYCDKLGNYELPWLVVALAVSRAYPKNGTPVREEVKADMPENVVTVGAKPGKKAPA